MGSRVKTIAIACCTVIALAVAAISVWLSSSNHPNQVDKGLVVQPGENAPTGNKDLETLKHIKDMSQNLENR